MSMNRCEQRRTLGNSCDHTRNALGKATVEIAAADHDHVRPPQPSVLHRAWKRQSRPGRGQPSLASSNTARTVSSAQKR